MADNSWFTLEYRHSTKWSFHREEAPKRARLQIVTTKFMLIVIWGLGGFQVVDLMTCQRSFDPQYFVSNFITPLIANILAQGRIPHAHRLCLHLDNCCVHFSNVTE
jgi:hypothetical protein